MDRTRGRTRDISLAAEQKLTHADFGFAGRGTINGVVFQDQDRDGIQRLWEEGLGGVQVEWSHGARRVNDTRDVPSIPSHLLCTLLHNTTLVLTTRLI